MTPEEFIETYKEEDFILTSLRIEGHSLYPNGSDYIHEFIQAGWRINQIAILNREEDEMQFSEGGLLSISVADADIMAPNRLANHLRILWEWI